MPSRLPSPSAVRRLFEGVVGGDDVPAIAAVGAAVGEYDLGGVGRLVGGQEGDQVGHAAAVDAGDLLIEGRPRVGHFQPTPIERPADLSSSAARTTRSDIEVSASLP